MKICFSSTASPWFFGPYGKQLSLLCNYFINHNYDVYYLLLINTGEIRKYQYQELIKLDTSRKDNIDKELLHKIKFIGGITKQNNKILVSNINEICDIFKINHIFFLMDLTNLCFDNYFNCTSYVWYPNHFNPISIENQNKLKYFDKIIALSKNDKNLINDTLKSNNIDYVPHIIDINPPNQNKSILREKYNFKKDDFIIFMNIGNYDIQNRKSIDTALFAFEEYLIDNDGILFIHTYNVREIDVNNHYTPMSNFFEIDDLLQYLNIPKNNIRIINKIIDEITLSEYYFLSDVLLQTSKSEGFGLPILEAQKNGLPVITTNFGAMSEYTYYGISVEPCQRLYDNIGKGVWCIPSIEGIKKSLIIIKNNNHIDNKEYAINKINNDMSCNNVGKSIQNIISNTKKINHSKINNKLLQIIYYTDEKYILNGVEYNDIQPIQVYGKWVLFIKKNMIFKEKVLEGICKINNEYDIIVLPTKYKNKVYPSKLDLQINNLEPDNMNYMIKSKKIKSFLEFNLLHQHMKGFLLLSTMNNSRVNVIEEVKIIESI